MKRAPKLQSMLDKLADKFNISSEFIEASDHPYSCKCDQCAEWWLQMGRDPDTKQYGAFTDMEMKEYLEKQITAKTAPPPQSEVDQT